MGSNKQTIHLTPLRSSPKNIINTVVNTCTMMLMAMLLMMVTMVCGDCGVGDCTGVVTINNDQLEGECLTGVTGTRWCYVGRKSGCGKTRYKGRFVSKEACYKGHTGILNTIDTVQPVRRQGEEVCKTVEEDPCNFPFVYNGTTYTKCSLVDSPTGKPWCATQVYTKNRELVGNMWGECQDWCKVQQSGASVIQPRTEKNGKT